MIAKSVEVLTPLLTSGERIVSRHVAELRTTDAGRFGHVGLCQLSTKRLVRQTSTT